MDIRYFHDEKCKDLLPLTYLKEPQELRCGILTLAEKTQYALKDSKLGKNRIVFVNSRLLINEDVKKELKNKAHSFVLVNNGVIVLAVLKNDGNISHEQIEELCAEKITVKSCLIEYPWDLIYKNGDEIANDLRISHVRVGFKPLPALPAGRQAARHGAPAKRHGNISFINPKNIFTSKTAKIYPGVVIDAEAGPVVVDAGATIMANSVITGPVYIGKGTVIKALSKIYGSTSIGPMCKIGGEVESTIFQGYSNKQHEGFIGHSFIGEWVNLGAGTNNSDLKNNYTNVKIIVNGKEINTGKLFMGAIIGDHTKTGINTMINTGTVIGISCNLFMSGYLPRHIPSFSWGGSGGLKEYTIEKAVETAKAAMKRRDLEMNKEYESKFRRKALI
ncbi:MAG: putative sugar nucleotidyl transferase [Candidatus Margulisiibacteriota bacterium]